MKNEDDTFTVTVKGKTLTYKYFYELCEFVDELYDLDPIEDEAKIVSIAQNIEARATRHSG